MYEHRQCTQKSKSKRGKPLGHKGSKRSPQPGLARTENDNNKRVIQIRLKRETTTRQVVSMVEPQRHRDAKYAEKDGISNKIGHDELNWRHVGPRLEMGGAFHQLLE